MTKDFQSVLFDMFTEFMVTNFEGVKDLGMISKKGEALNQIQTSINDVIEDSSGSSVLLSLVIAANESYKLSWLITDAGSKKLSHDIFIGEMENLIIGKRNDYSNDNDVLSNFKRSAKFINSTPGINCLNFIGTKIARLENLINKTEIKYESMADTCLDLANYCFLYYCILVENLMERSGLIPLPLNTYDFIFDKSTNDSVVDRSTFGLITRILIDADLINNNSYSKSGRTLFINCSPISIEHSIEKIREVLDLNGYSYLDVKAGAQNSSIEIKLTSNEDYK